MRNDRNKKKNIVGNDSSMNQSLNISSLATTTTSDQQSTPSQTTTSTTTTTTTAPTTTSQTTVPNSNPTANSSLLLLDSINSVTSQVLSSSQPVICSSPATTPSVASAANIIHPSTVIHHQSPLPISHPPPIVQHHTIINDQQSNLHFQQQPPIETQTQYNPNPSSSEIQASTQAQADRLADEDSEIVELCQRLFEQTFESGLLVGSATKKQQQITTNSSNSNGLQNLVAATDYDEFTQVGIRKCVKFCMNLPGNNDLCTDDRAKLLKYGVYEIAVDI